MQVDDVFRLGVEIQVRRVLSKMGEQRILDGITAFETGASSWSSCFFARAYPEINLNHGNPEWKIAAALGMETTVPMRIVYTLFDGIGKGRTFSKAELLNLMRGFLDEKRSPEMQSAIEDLISSQAGAIKDAQQGSIVWRDVPASCSSKAGV